MLQCDILQNCFLYVLLVSVCTQVHNSVFSVLVRPPADSERSYLELTETHFL